MNYALRSTARRVRSSVAPSRAIWDESMTLVDLKVQMEEALKVEDYSLAARLRDLIQYVEVAWWMFNEEVSCAVTIANGLE